MELIQDLDDAMWDPKLQIPEEFRNLEPIWRKLNKASLDHTAMKRENKQLMEENSALQAAMKQYLDTISKEGEELSRAGIEAEKRERAERSTSGKKRKWERVEGSENSKKLKREREGVGVRESKRGKELRGV